MSKSASKDLALRRSHQVTAMPSDYLDFLPEVEALSVRRHSPLATLTILIILVLFGALVGWMAYANVEQTAVAEGEVRPDGRVKLVNHEDGVRVAEILVGEGERVRAGQVLLRLDDELLRTEVEKARNEREEASMRAARLEAEALGERTLTLAPDLREARPDLAALEERAFLARGQALLARRAAADRQIEQRRSEIESLAVQISTRRQSAAILEEQATALAGLVDKGHYPWLRHQSVLRDLTERRGQILELEQDLVTARAALAEAEARRRQIDEEWTAAVLDDLTATRSRAEQARLRESQLADKLERMVVTSPADGLVKDLAVNNPGQVIQPRAPILSVVPQGARLVIEARVPDSDIGFVKVGQSAKVKVRTYDFIKYGTLDGRIESIAPDSDVDERTGIQFYKVTIRTEKAHLGDDPAERPVVPGMQVDVDIKTGERTILSYLTDRVLWTTSSAFHER